MSLKRDSVTTKFKNYSSGMVLDKNFSSSDAVTFLLKALNGADYQLSANIENDLVKFGKKAVNQLIETLESSDRKLRKHAAMALIRIGEDSVAPLVFKYKYDMKTSWIADFIITEIMGSMKPVTEDDCFDMFYDNNYYSSKAS